LPKSISYDNLMVGDFGKDGELIVLLLLGGAKASQARDIRKAREFWRDYLEAKRHGKTK
jgi:hypothetical protein